MQPFAIELPNQILRFSLPKQLVHQMFSFQVEKRLFLSDKALIRDGYRDVARDNYPFERPFWMGTNGWFEFSLSVVKPLSEYAGDITTLDGLDHYIRWWTAAKNSRYGFQFDRCLVGGRTRLRRSKNTFSGPRIAGGDEIVDSQIISFPLDKDLFFQATFLIESESVPTASKKWKGQADAFREAIETSLVLEDKMAEHGN